MNIDRVYRLLLNYLNDEEARKWCQDWLVAGFDTQQLRSCALEFDVEDFRKIRKDLEMPELDDYETLILTLHYHCYKNEEQCYQDIVCCINLSEQLLVELIDIPFDKVEATDQNSDFLISLKQDLAEVGYNLGEYWRGLKDDIELSVYNFTAEERVNELRKLEEKILTQMKKIMMTIKERCENASFFCHKTLLRND